MIFLTKYEAFINWSHEKISPFLFSCCITCAALLKASHSEKTEEEYNQTIVDKIIAYFFVYSFLVGTFMLLNQSAFYIYRKGWVKWLYNHIDFAIKLIQYQINKMKEMYIAKVLFGVSLSFSLLSIWVWIHNHVDVLQSLKSTAKFIIELMTSLFNADLLIKRIHVWVNKSVLQYIILIISHLWSYIKNIIVNEPLLGLIIIILVVVATFLLAWFINCIGELIGSVISPISMSNNENKKNY